MLINLLREVAIFGNLVYEKCDFGRGRRTIAPRIIICAESLLKALFVVLLAMQFKDSLVWKPFSDC